MVKLDNSKSIVEQIYDELGQRLGRCEDFDVESKEKLKELIDSESLSSLEMVELAIKPIAEGE